MSGPIRMALQIPNFTYPNTPPAALFERVAATAREAESAGFDAVLVMDHFYQLPMLGPTDHEMLEAYPLLGALATQTSRVRLGTLVSGNTYRNPAHLAKIVTTLDVVSGGRGRLGIGASWYEREQRALGVPVVPVPERFERLEETLQICRQMWSDNDGPYEGRHYQLAETLCSPRPLTQPHPPILVGGGGEKRTLLLVARYADACNLFATSPADISHKLDVLRRHCDDEGRNYDSITKTALHVGPPVLDNTDQFLTDAQQYAELGLSEVEVMPDRNPADFTTNLAERVVPRLNAIG